MWTPSDQLAVIDANEAAIEEAGVVLHSYTAPGDGHGIFEWPKFYELEVNGEKLVDWVTRLIEGNRSTTCTAGSAASADRLPASRRDRGGSCAIATAAKLAVTSCERGRPPLQHRDPADRQGCPPGLPDKPSPS